MPRPRYDYERGAHANFIICEIGGRPPIGSGSRELMYLDKGPSVVATATDLQIAELITDALNKHMERLDAHT